MNPTYDFSGQVALVTGAGAGMGLDTARAFAAAGAAVVLADINHDALAAATDELAGAARSAALSPAERAVQDGNCAPAPGTMRPRSGLLGVRRESPSGPGP